MIDTDHSVVIHRTKGESQSGVIVHLSDSILLLEIYERNSMIRINEVLANIRVNYGRVCIYDGRAVVRDVADASSIQLITLYLIDSPIAISSNATRYENQFSLERFLKHNRTALDLPIELERSLFDFSFFLSNLLGGLKRSRQNSLLGIETEPDEDENPCAVPSYLELAVEQLVNKYKALEALLSDTNEYERLQAGLFFKRHIFHQCNHSKIIRNFHSVRRSWYVNYGTWVELFEQKNCKRYHLGGRCLDAFLRQVSGFDVFTDRAQYWVDDIRNWLTHNSGQMQVLLAGSDATPVLLAEQLPREDLERLNIDLYIPFEYSPYLNQMEQRSVARFKELIPNFRCIHTPMSQVLHGYFGGKTALQSSYDRVFSSTITSSASSKLIAYAVAFALKYVKPSGSLNVFVNHPDYSPVREHWLLWFDRFINFDDWKGYLPVETQWTLKRMDIGQLVEFRLKTTEGRGSVI